MTDVDLNTDEESSSPKKGGGKKILFIVIALIILLGAGGGAYVFFINPSILGGAPETASVEAGGAESGNTEEIQQTIIPLDEIIVNIRDKDFQRLFKLKISIELLSGQDFEAVQQKIPVLLDSFQSHIRGMRITEIEGSRAIYRIKEELIARANIVLHPIRIKNILFAEMLLQ